MTTGAAMLQWLKAEGHSVTLRDGVIVVELNSPVTKAQREVIKDHSRELLEALTYSPGKHRSEDQVMSLFKTMGPL